MVNEFRYQKLIFIGILLFVNSQISAQKEFLVTVDPSNGAVTKIDSIPGITWIHGYDLAAYCESEHRYTFLGSEDINGTPSYLFTVDAISGHIISKPMYPDPYTFYNLHYARSDSLLYGIILNSGVPFLVLVNTTSGTYSIIRGIPFISSIIKFIVDDLHNRLYIYGGEASGDPGLLTMNLQTGDIISKVTTPSLNNVVYDQLTDKLYALSNRSGGTAPGSRFIFSISRIDPNTGLIHVIADLPNLDYMDPGMETMDEKDNLYIFSGLDKNDSLNYLYSIDVTTGKIIYRSAIPMYNVYDKDNLVEFRFDNNLQKLYALLWDGKKSNPVADSSCKLNVKTKLYPNPISDLLIVEKKTTICKVKMNLYNALGQLLIEGQLIGDGKNEIHLARLSKGIYFYKFTSDANTILTGKIIKQ